MRNSVLWSTKAGYEETSRQRRRAGWALVVTALLAGTFGCVDNEPLFGPNDPEEADILSARSAAEVSQRAAEGRTLREHYAAIARRVPGGFGGLLYDEQGRLTVMLRSPQRLNEAVSALRSEPLVESKRDASGNPLPLANARARKVDYDYGQLSDWYEAILARVGFAPAISGISIRANAIVLAAADERQRNQVRRILEETDIPNAAVLIRDAPTIRRAKSLRSEFRPVPGGVQIQFKRTGVDPFCTIGLSVIRHPTGFGEEEGFLVASHCTKYMADSVTTMTYYWQDRVNEWWQQPTVRYIGNEALDPYVFECSENPQFGCRNADVALGLYQSQVDGDLGRIARPISRNSEDVTIDPSTPFFTIASRAREWSIEGEVLEKVGKTTGWSGGEVIEGCMSIAQTDVYDQVIGPSIRCTMIVDAEAGSGDSGAPVFRITSGGQAELRGLVWGITDDHGRCQLISEDEVHCPTFYASNWGGVVMDLDPDRLAPLQIVPGSAPPPD